MQTQQTALKEVINRLQAPKDVMHFAEHFYKFAALEELTNWSEDAFYGATLSTWKFLQNFNSNTPKIRLFNPDINLDGWQSPHTFIQILNTDMPLLVDSLRLLINRRHLTLHSLHNAIFAVQRSGEGELERLTAASEETSQKTESLILIEVEAITDEQERNQIQEELLAALDEVRLAVTDFTAMQNQALAISKQLKAAAEAQVQLGDELVSLNEASDFFSWIADKHFIFLGYDEYRLEEKDQQQHLCKLAGSELGLLKLDDSLTSPCTPLSSITTDLLTFAKASRLARVHRAAFPDEIIVQTFDATGKVTGEKRFVGLYTSAVYNKIPQDIPVLRKKVTSVVKSIGMQPRSHNGRQLLQILDSYPRDDLFQIGLEELTSTALGIFKTQNTCFYSPRSAKQTLFRIGLPA